MLLILLIDSSFFCLDLITYMNQKNTKAQTKSVISAETQLGTKEIALIVTRLIYSHPPKMQFIDPLTWLSKTDNDLRVRHVLNRTEKVNKKGKQNGAKLFILAHALEIIHPHRNRSAEFSPIKYELSRHWSG